jgi:hypothetical protein
MKSGKFATSKFIMKDPDMVRALRDINNRCREFGALRYFHFSPSRVGQSLHWICPFHGCIKFNCDATIGVDCSCLAMVARDWRGTVVLAISKNVNTTIPLQAEAETILWASQLVEDLGLVAVQFENDSKQCMDAVNSRDVVIPWRVYSCISNVKYSFVAHPSWVFSRVNRKANGAPHALARWSLFHRFWGPFNFYNGPQAFADACKFDLGTVPM